ncbi:SpoVR family protein [Chromobacterium subtsugae]|uniref:SpoVR family protein n=3 Tax=Chromobacterium subtsugae TaxID=251747 RepID=A0ABS7FGR0_9NEIS|nr:MULTISPECIES: SpoVR family protein [Chromobacterium]KUM05711.1 SpoVR family protein [Chromobacterium subtsugae]KZE84623.1 SpoVR family protein [Chromobacterium sp. F49]MBW7568170.1 SpoVR family protein [Chromobacterium subtsugae]MBW8289281.1 SpoVR family protein [Chromobacterium subtsugae]WSE90365.1 SpoVR family protein [Chromobacterium subtsugae]
MKRTRKGEEEVGKPISTGSEWTFDLIGEYDRQIRTIAVDEFKLDVYPNQLEVITAEQMMDAYASVGMPVNYHHWSYGKHFVSTEKSYKRGQMGLAYEIVINSNPCIAYLMEENSMMMQALVIAHAAYGHNSFFKGNYLFRSWTDASAIIDYLVFAKSYISKCEERYGIDEVEELLDSCHALMNYGVDRYKRPQKLSLAKEQARQEEREQYLQMQVNDLWRTIPKRDKDDSGKPAPRFPLEPQENLLYFIEKSAPLLEPWQREVVRIVRKVAQYFYPQRQTQVMNEGWATFWHYTIMNRLYDKGLITDGYMLEFLQSHTNVVTQPPVTARWYNGINPYALGFAMYQDIKRICEAPTDEDRAWFPDLAGSDWRESLEFAMRNFKDESFISQYLSPKLIRDFRFFAIRDDDKDDKLEISSIHDEEGYRDIRGKLAEQYNLGSREPNIQVWSVNVRGDRSLTLRHVMHNRRPLEDQSAQEVLKHVCRLWGFDVKLESVDGNGEVKQSYEVQAVRDPEMA